ncbi:MAG: glycoside hydrolase family 15 protein [Nocardioidaceae bacterium]
MTSPASDASTLYPPHVLREYSLLADGERGIVVGSRGEFAWMCAPRWDSDAVFSSLVGGEGVYAITPTAERFVWGGYYEEGSLIFRSRWVTNDAVIECREALAFPADKHRAVVLRRIVAVSGHAQVEAILDARADFGTKKMARLSNHDGIWSARSGDLHVRWLGAPTAAVRHQDGWLRSTIDVDEGQHHELVLEISDQPLPQQLVDPSIAWSATEHAWSETVPDLTNTLTPRDSRHAYAVMRGLTSTDGGMVAAATMSLPEHAREGRNYDYRYAWIRDQCYAGIAVGSCGEYPLLTSAIDFVTARLLDDGPELKPAYTVDGGRTPSERHLKLPGYPGGADVVGNRVNQQFQLDALGEALQLFAVGARHGQLEADNWRAVEATVDAIRKRRADPDAGIWELGPAYWAHSRLSCAAGLRAISSGAPTAQSSQWAALADELVVDTDRDCRHESGRWQRAPDDSRVDAALIVPAFRGAITASDPRTLATLAAVREELGSDGYVYRFAHDGRPLSDAEGAFLLCGFQMAMAVHQQGDEVEARHWFERNRAACGPSGLFTEEYDVVQRQLRGNMPQAFVHAVLLESSRRLSEPWPANGCP